MFSFSSVGVPIGSELTFINDENIKAKVLDDKFILFEGKKMSLTGSTLLILARQGKNHKSIRGTSYWVFDKSPLSEYL
jgi:hypothetical protein